MREQDVVGVEHAHESNWHSEETQRMDQSGDCPSSLGSTSAPAINWSSWCRIDLSPNRTRARNSDPNGPPSFPSLSFPALYTHRARQDKPRAVAGLVVDVTTVRRRAEALWKAIDANRNILGHCRKSGFTPLEQHTRASNILSALRRQS